MSPAIELREATRRAGGRDLVGGLSFQVARGTICGLLAPSGGGKTTTIRLLTGILPPSSGEVCVLGGAPHRFGDDERRRLGYMPQHFVLYPELTVRRNLAFVAGLYALSPAERDERIAALLALVDLADAADRPARRLSGGMRRRLQLAATLLHDPEVLVIDEPTAGIDPLLRARFWEQFRDLRDQGCTLVISTQYVTEAEHCDQVVMLRGGRVVADGSPEALRRMVSLGAASGGPAPSFEEVFLRLMAREGAAS